MVDQSAERVPERDAFRFGKHAITYADLMQETNQLANLLVDHGVGRGDRVGVFMNRCLETAIAIHGIMKAGAAFVPLAPFAPPSRTRYLLQDCGIRHLVTDPSQRNALDQLLSPDVQLKSIIGIDGRGSAHFIPWEEVRALPAHRPPDVRVLGQDLAYVMYTSGTTGVPKGIMHTHDSGLSYAQLSADLYGLSSTDRIGNHAAIHFDISTMGYFSAPLRGATTVIIPEAHTKVPASLSKLMEDEQLTIWYSVPLALVQLLQHGVLEQRDLKALRWILFGGEPFAAKHLRALMKQWPQARFSNVYGPAEVNQCTYFHLPGPPETDDPVPLGTVWDNTEMLIMDEHDQPAQPGEPGELLIRSATMMKGYWGQPELTKKAFYIRDRIPGCVETFYRTGDLVRLDSNGTLHFMGRRDRQIKTRGYRVELDEVEAALLAHARIEEAAAIPRAGDTGDTLIEATVILRNGDGEIDESALRKHLKDLLPWYALPQKIFFTKTLPRTAAGKIDRKELERKAIQIE